MIVNKYRGQFKIKLSILNLDLYLLQKLNQIVKTTNLIGLCSNCDKYIEQKYLYRIRKKETELYLKETYDLKKVPLFSSVEIETINRCNGECPFCPVNRHTDPRKLKKMDSALFKKIIDELGNLNYSGRLALHSNNEPFLDSRIIGFAKYARKKVPDAYIYMFTNGTLLTLEKFNEIISYLDKMVIDNYDDELRLHQNVKLINGLCRKDRSLNKKVEIHVRKIHEVLNTRGGQSPNNQKKQTLHMSCILPYKQVVIRPDGKVSLCCNDPYGKYTLADINKITLKEAWYSERYAKIRSVLRMGRGKVKLCRYCDTLPDVKTY